MVKTAGPLPRVDTDIRVRIVVKGLIFGFRYPAYVAEALFTFGETTPPTEESQLQRLESLGAELDAARRRAARPETPSHPGARDPESK